MSVQEADLLCMRRIAAGDTGALAELYDRHAALVLSVTSRILRHPGDAEEALQDTWVQLWKQAGSYDPRRGSVAAWLVMVGRSRALDLYRSRSYRQRAEERLEASNPPRAASPAAAPEDRQLEERMAGAWNELEPQHRQVLELAFWEGLSQSEIAQRMGSPLGTVKSWTRQGMSRLRDGFRKEEWL